MVPPIQIMNNAISIVPRYMVTGQAGGLCELVCKGQKMRRGGVKPPPSKVLHVLIVVLVQLEQVLGHRLGIGNVVDMNERIPRNELFIIVCRHPQIDWHSSRRQGSVQLLCHVVFVGGSSQKPSKTCNSASSGNNVPLAVAQKTQDQRHPL